MWIGNDVTGRYNLSIVWIRTDDRGLCHNLIWGDMWIGTDYKLCCHDQRDRAMWIGKDGIRNIHDKFEIKYALQQIWKYADMRCYVDWIRCEIMLLWPYGMCYMDLKGCDRDFSRQIWSSIWIKSDELESNHDLILGDILIRKCVIWCCLDQINWYVDSNVCDRKHSRPIWCIMWISSDDTGWCLDQIWGAL
jgi:hypothetical protein